MSEGEKALEKVRRYEGLLRRCGLLGGDDDGDGDGDAGDGMGEKESGGRGRVNRDEAVSGREGVTTDDGRVAPVVATPPVSESTRLMSLLYFDQDLSKKTKVLASGQGNAKYINSTLWRDLGDEDMGEIYRDEQQDEELELEQQQPQQDTANNRASIVYQDPITAAFMGSQGQELLHYHPSHAEALYLWKTHTENVEPLCKILHIPTTSQIVQRVSLNPSTATKTDECLLFSIYHFAIFSMTEEDCSHHLHQQRTTLLSAYSFATRQALLNANFLKTTSLTILQSLVLFLMASRSTYDPHTFWIFTGVAARIAQRMGLHRDGEGTAELTPFQVQMRRRLFYQLLPLDGIASQMAGTGINIITDPNWDTKPALNLNDDQIWPSMAQEQVMQQKGATDMIFCLARVCIGTYFSKTVINPKTNLDDISARNAVDAMIAAAEQEVEEEYIRYVDILNPLHFLTLLSARSAITAMRLRSRLPKVKKSASTPEEQRELLPLAFKILDSDAAAYTNVGLRRYMWHIRPFFAWGTWDSLIFLLTSLRTGEQGWMTTSEREESWKRIEAMYENHAELLEAKRALQIAIGRLTLKAWEVCPPSTLGGLRGLRGSGGEPSPRGKSPRGKSPRGKSHRGNGGIGSEEEQSKPTFIKTLREARNRKGESKMLQSTGERTQLDTQANPVDSLFDPSPEMNVEANEINVEANDGRNVEANEERGMNEALPGLTESNLGQHDFDFDSDLVDWTFWDNLMSEDQRTMQ